MTSLAVQIHGGMGYVEETGVAQHYRDARIAAIYEGTNGIQAADLVGRKLGDARRWRRHRPARRVRCRARASSTTTDGMGAFGERLREAVGDCPHGDGAPASTSARPIRGRCSAASAPYLRLLGTTVCAGLLAKGAVAAAGRSDEFGAAKVASARFFGEQMLPAAAGLLPAVLADAATSTRSTPDSSDRPALIIHGPRRR